MTPREKLDLLRSYRAAGGTGSYASLLKEARSYDAGGPKKKIPELQPYTYKEPIAESTKTQPVAPKPVATPYKIQPTQKDVGEIKVADDSRELEDNSSKDYWSYKERIKRNVDKSVEGVGKVLDKVVLPSAALVASFSGATIPSMLGSGYLGNQMSNMEEPYMESMNSASGQITSKFLPLSEPIKRIGGFNDFKTAYNEFKKGNVRSGLLNTATGIGGVYDSHWIPGRYDDVVDKGLELLNLYGDGMDIYKGIKRKIDVSNTKKK